jgi:hypothetical protein
MTGYTVPRIEASQLISNPLVVDGVRPARFDKAISSA